MPRARKPGTEWLPPRVYPGKSAYEFRPHTGETVKLAPLTASREAVLRRYHEELEAHERQAGSMNELINDFFKSADFRTISPASQKKYQQNSKKVLAVFGKMSAKAVKPEHIRQYMDKRGQTGKVAANREHAFMSRLFNWAYERGRVPVNPCRGVRKFSEKSRDRYISDAEYTAVYNAADQLTQAIMEISYCCAARISDVLALTVDQETPDGLYIKQGKTGKAQIKQWSPRLQAAVAHAKAAQTHRSTHRIVANHIGQKLTYDAFRERWDKARRTAQANHPELKIDFTFHDIKAKAISDWDGDKKAMSGHKSDSQIAVYDRKPHQSPTH
ncbi:MAG TPA: integrase [Gammaproteobacteria bacterium]|nr:integrase [Gammaproteobacteria bacterium]